MDVPIIIKEASEIRKAVKIYGGSFMKALVGAMECADIYNLQKIKDTWPDEWNQYLEMANIMEERGIK